MKPLLKDIFDALDKQSSEEERTRGINHVSHNNSLINDFSEVYETLSRDSIE